MAKLNTGSVFRSLKIVWQSSPQWTIINSFVVLLKGVLPLLLIYIIQLLVDQVSDVVANQEHVSQQSSFYLILIFAGGVFILNALLSSVSGLISEKHSYYINDTVQNLIHYRTTKLYFANYDDFNFQNIYFRAVNEAAYRPSKIYYGFIGLMQNSVTLLLIAVLLVDLHWAMLIVLIFLAIPVVFIRLNFSKRIFNLKREHTEKERGVNYYNTLLTGKQFAKELRLFNLAGLFKNRYEKQKNILREKQYVLLKIKTKYEFAVQLITALSLIVVFGYISKVAINGDITQGQMVMFFLALYRGHSFLQDLLSRISGLYEDGLFLNNFFEFLDYEVIKHSHERAFDFPIIKNSISIENLSFKYPNSSRSVFENVNLKIQPNETIALVGANGSGKSTLVKLLCGLYEPESGIVKIDGVDLSMITKESISNNISVVFQDFLLYNTTARENIWFGNINRQKADVDIIKSAKNSGIDQLFSDLPKGYETNLGNLFKDSEMLSQGEWQRVALSRSFFNDAQLVILDEPTSSLDVYTESKLIENFKSIIHGRTAIIVSHRLSTIHLADRIVVLGKQGILEEGKPSVLMQKKGEYYNMVQSIINKGV